MHEDRWQRVKHILGAALERPAEARDAFLREACGEDEGLRHEVESLLAARQDAGDFLSAPAQMPDSAAATVSSDRLPRDVTSGALAIGTRLGPYEVVAFVGAGGMGEVYKARDTRLDRLVAIKMLLGDLAADPDRVRRFEHEARAISKLNHPHICALYDVGQHDGSTFLVMEYLEGENLAERLRKGALPVAEAIRCATQIAEALDEAHRQGIVHRDLKPANVMLTRQGAKLLDFGIAKLRAAAGSEEAPTGTAAETTGEGVIVGTPQYMAPEQLEGKPVDARTDIFAFGVVLYEMVSGRKPFEAPSQAGLIAAILQSEPAPLSRIQPQAPAGLDRLVRRCLAKDPRDRWSSCRELVVTLGETGRAWSRRRRAVTATTAGGLLLLAAVALWPRRAHDPAPPLAPEVPAKSIAVLPFQNLSPDPDNAYFADGMTEDILTQLAKIQDMKVIARTSVMRYKGSDKPVREIARELGVATVLEGSVRRAGNRVRITGQLIDARTERHLWAETYDRELADIFAMQSEVAQQIAAALKASLTPEDRTRMAERPTGNMEAYDLYVKGRALYYQYRKLDNEQAIELFRKALAVDPGFALAQAGLADSLHQRYARFATFLPADLDAAAAAARKAVELNPQLPEAHKAVANTASSRGHLHEALAENRRAVDLSQGTGFVAGGNLGFTLLLLGRFDEALPWARRSVEQDPTNVAVVGHTLSSIYDAIGETAQAEATLRRAVELNPKIGTTYITLMTLYLRHQRTKDALEVARNALSLVSDEPYVIRMAALTEWVAGNEARAKELLDRVVPSLQGQRNPLTPEGVETDLAWLDTKAGNGASAKKRLEAARTADQRQLDSGNEFWGVPFDLACVNAIEGDKDEALRWLDKAYDAGWRGWPQASWTPLLDPLRKDPRFQTLMRRIDQDVAAMRRRAGLG